MSGRIRRLPTPWGEIEIDEDGDAVLGSHLVVDFDDTRGEEPARTPAFVVTMRGCLYLAQWVAEDGSLRAKTYRTQKRASARARASWGR